MLMFTGLIECRLSRTLWYKFMASDQSTHLIFVQFFVDVAKMAVAICHCCHSLLFPAVSILI
jgi:hypothetical protein